jgi:hypothetical protein
MDTTTPTAALRYFPLLGRPKPPCPPLQTRVAEITDLAHAAARAEGTDQMTLAATALNKAALIASDCGLPELATELCWHHINVYRAAAQPLTAPAGAYLLEPVLNLARLAIRAQQTDQALNLLEDMYRAVTQRTDLVIDGQTLPLADLTGTTQDRRALRRWAWLACLNDGIRALAAQQSWPQAAEHAQRHNGVGLHLMEGRQAVIIALYTQGEHAAAQATLAKSTLTEPWEQLVAACLRLACAQGTNPSDTSSNREVLDKFHTYRPNAGYIPFYTRLGLTIIALISHLDETTAAKVLSRIAESACTAADGYAAREVLQYPRIQELLPEKWQKTLADIVATAGLGSGALPGTLRTDLIDTTRAALESLAASLEPATSRFRRIQPRT